MSEYKIINERRFPLKVHSINDNNDLLEYHRWEHRVTIGRRGKRYMVFLDNLENTIYIEEITSGSLEQIDDDPLLESLSRFAASKGFLAILPPLPKPREYNQKGQKTLSPPIKV